MKLLLDTHIILWVLDDNPKLPNEARTLIMDMKNEIYYSSASVWETTIKYMSRPDKIRISGSRVQAKADGLRFVTHDSKIPFYEEECVIVV